MGLLGLIFNPCFVLPVVAGIAAMKGMPHIASGIGATFATGVILFVGFCFVALFAYGL